MKYEDDFETEVTEFEFNSYHRMPSRNHSILQTRIAYLLEDKYGNDFSILTAVDLDLPTGKAVPDIAIYPKIQISDWEEDIIKMTDPPLTAIEILSPKQALTDLTDKNKKIYFPSGVKSVWLVMPVFKSIYIYSAAGRILFDSGMMKDPTNNIEISLDAIFK
jgi:Uma2 family endonuclease